MTEMEERQFLLAVQGNEDLRGACVVVIEGSFPRVLQWHHATGPRVCLALYKLDATNRGWSEPAWRRNVQLQLGKVGMALTDLSFPFVVGGEYACFPGVAGPERTRGFGAGARAASPAEGQAALVRTTKGMQEVSFNTQHLQIQNSRQSENRQFAMVSNIMKTKHDTVKNSISNVR